MQIDGSTEVTKPTVKSYVDLIAYGSGVYLGNFDESPIPNGVTKLMGVGPFGGLKTKDSRYDIPLKEFTEQVVTGRFISETFSSAVNVWRVSNPKFNEYGLAGYDYIHSDGATSMLKDLEIKIYLDNLVQRNLGKAEVNQQEVDNRVYNHTGIKATIHDTMTTLVNDGYFASLRKGSLKTTDRLDGSVKVEMIVEPGDAYLLKEPTTAELSAKVTKLEQRVLELEGGK